MFQPRFTGPVERGEKLQTIRPMPKRMPVTGDRLSLRTWTDKPYRSKQRVLREAVVASCEPVRIDWVSLTLGEECWIYGGRGTPEMERFAKADGFLNWNELVEWFREQHGLPFKGVLIRWKGEEDVCHICQTPFSEEERPGEFCYTCIRCEDLVCTVCSENDPRDPSRVICEECWTDEDEEVRS